MKSLSPKPPREIAIRTPAMRLTLDTKEDHYEAAESYSYTCSSRVLHRSVVSNERCALGVFSRSFQKRETLFAIKHAVQYSNGVRYSLRCISRRYGTTAFQHGNGHKEKASPEGRVHEIWSTTRKQFCTK
jgi:hypothetical protein